MVGAKSVRGDLIGKVGEDVREGPACLFKRPAKQCLHLGARGGLADGLFRKRGQVLDDPGEGGLSECCHLCGIGMDYRSKTGECFGCDAIWLAQ